MKPILIILSTILLSISANSQPRELLYCMSGGFAYNVLSVKEDGTILKFSTRGIGMNFKSKNTPPVGSILQNVEFSFFKSDCHLSNLTEYEITCYAEATEIKSHYYNSNNSTTESREEEPKYVNLILKNISSSSGIKLILMQDYTRERLVISNSFRQCYVK